MSAQHARRLFILALSALAFLLLSNPLFAQRARPNIDDLTAEEMQTLQAAMRVLKERPSGNWNSYVYFQNRHNLYCEHGSEAFLPWHRAVLRMFEQALQQTGVPGAEDIMLPYWDWSQPPSGQRYPQTCEDPNSEFYHPGRIQPGAGAPPLPLSSLADARAAQTWSDFGGIPPTNEFGIDPPGPGFMERPPHNFMHSGYIGGDMYNVSEAAIDPMFWLFHAGIDFFWWQWQQTYPNARPVHPHHQLRGLGFHTIGSVWNAEAMGYTYGTRLVVHNGSSFGGMKENQPLKSYHFEITVPRPGFDRAELQISGAKMDGAMTYTTHYYLHPTDVPYSSDAEFKEKYYAGLDAHFGNKPGAASHHEGHHPARGNLRVNITNALAKLAKNHTGEKRRVTVVYEGQRDATTGRPTPVLLGRDVDHGPIYLVLE